MRAPLADFKDLLKSFRKLKVRFIVVGAYAMGHWGYVRATGDLDLLVAIDEENVTKLLDALKAFGAPSSNLSPDDFKKPGFGFQIGLPPLRIDILTNIDGVSTEQAFQRAHKGKLLGLSVPVLSLPDLIRNKAATGRPKDLADVIALRALGKEKEK